MERIPCNSLDPCPHSEGHPLARTSQQCGGAQRITLADQVCSMTWWAAIEGVGKGREPQVDRSDAFNKCIPADTVRSLAPLLGVLHAGLAEQAERTHTPSTSPTSSPISTGQACSSASTPARGTLLACRLLPPGRPLRAPRPGPLCTEHSPPAAAAAAAAAGPVPGVAGAWGAATGGCLAPTPRMGPLPFGLGAACAAAGGASSAGAAATSGCCAPTPLMGPRLRAALGRTCAAAAAAADVPAPAGTCWLPPAAAWPARAEAPPATRTTWAMRVRFVCGRCFRSSSSSSSCSCTFEQGSSDGWLGQTSYVEGLLQVDVTATVELELRECPPRCSSCHHTALVPSGCAWAAQYPS